MAVTILPIGGTTFSAQTESFISLTCNYTPVSSLLTQGGTLIVVTVTGQYGNTTYGIKDNAATPNTLTSVTPFNFQGTNYIYMFYYIVPAGASPTSFIFTGGTASYGSMCIEEYYAGSSVNVTVTTASGSSTPASISKTTTAANSFVVAGMGCITGGFTGVATTTPQCVQRQIQNNTHNMNSCLVDNTTASAGSITCAEATTASWGCVALEVFLNSTPKILLAGSAKVSTATASTNPTTISYTPVASGNDIIVLFCEMSVAQGSGITVVGNVTTTSLTSGTSITNSNEEFLYYGIAQATDTGYTITPSTTAEMSATLAEFLGVSSLSNMQTNSGGSSSTTATVSVTTTQANDWVIGALADGSNSLTVSGSGVSVQQVTAGTARSTLVSSNGIIATNGTLFTVSATLSAHVFTAIACELVSYTSGVTITSTNQLRMMGVGT
jgi:hypothetical protein